MTNALIIASKPKVRAALRSALRQAEVRTITECEDLSEVGDAIASCAPDLIVAYPSDACEPGFLKGLQARGAAVLVLADDGTVAATLLPSPRPRHLPVESGNHTRLLAIDEIDWIEAAGKYVTVHSEGRTFRLRAGLTKVTEQLPYPEFIRVHRSVVVRAERVRELHRWFRGAYYLVLTDGTRLASGATYRTQIERALLGGQRPPL
jgi:hypothetical protein